MMTIDDLPQVMEQIKSKSMYKIFQVIVKPSLDSSKSSLFIVKLTYHLLGLEKLDLVTHFLFLG